MASDQGMHAMGKAAGGKDLGKPEIIRVVNLPTQYESGTVAVDAVVPAEEGTRSKGGQEDDGGSENDGNGSVPAGGRRRKEGQDGDEDGLTDVEDGSEDVGKRCPGVKQQADHFRCFCKDPDVALPN